MKRFHSFALALLMGAALSSCSSGRYFQFAAHSTSYHHAPGGVAAPPAEAPAAVVVEAPAAAEPVLTASAAAVAVPAPAPVVSRPAPAAPRLSEQIATARAERQLTRAQERRYERILTRVQKMETQREATGQKVDAAELILAIFLPPIGVLLHENGINSKFWISLLLTILFFIPGMIYSILVVTDNI